MKFNKYLFLSLIILFGFGLRLIPAIKNDFWIDEAHSFYFSRGSSFADLFLGRTDPCHTFLYYFFMKIWSSFNSSILFLRLPSLVCSLLNIILVFKIGQKLKINKWFSSVSALLSAISPFQIEYSWWARMYTLELFFVLLSIFSLQQYVLSQKNRWGLLFAFVNILGFYTDYSFVWYLLAVHIFNLVILFRKNPKSLTFLIISDLAIIAYFPVFLNNFSIMNDWLVENEKLTFYIFKSTLFWLFGIKDCWDNNIKDSWFLFLLLVILISLKISGKNKKNLKSLLTIIICFCLPFILFLPFTYLSSSSLFRRWHFLGLSFIPIFLFSYIISFSLGNKRILYKLFGLLILSFVIYLNLKLYYKTSGWVIPRKEGWFYKEVAKVVKTEKDALEEDHFVFIKRFELLFDYYINDYDDNDYNDSRPYRVHYLDEAEAVDLGVLRGNLWIIIPPFIDVDKPPKRLEKNVYFRLIKNRSYYRHPNVYKLNLSNLIR